MKSDSNPMDIYTLDGLLCGHSHLQITAPPADKWLLFLMIEQEMFSIYKQSVWIKGAATFILLLLTNGYTTDIKLYKVEIMQHSKESVRCVRNLIHNIK